VAGLKSESIVKNSNAQRSSGDKAVQYEESLKKALAEEEREILSSWRDGSGAGFNSGKKAGELAKATLRISSNRSIEGADRDKIWEAVTSMGGENGWLSMNTLWRIRGHVDKITGGRGSTAEEDHPGCSASATHLISGKWGILYPEGVFFSFRR
jgi:hypothetical protein